MAKHKSTRLCSVSGCAEAHLAKGLCSRHYQRQKKHGDPTVTLRDRYPDAATRLAASTEQHGDCLVWTGAIDSWGYGLLRVGRRTISPHRFAWEAVNDPIPKGMEVDHRCHNRTCCNVSHLRLATRKQNAENNRMRSDNTSGYRGVSWHDGKWRAVVKHNGRKYIAGRFDDVHEAGAAAKALRLRLFTYNDIDRKGGSS